MRKLTMAFLFCLNSSIANAQAFQLEKPVICDTVENVMTALKDKYGEKVQWFGNDIKDGTGYILTVNAKLGTWTYIQFDKKSACVLGTGTGSNSQFGEPS